MKHLTTFLTLIVAVIFLPGGAAYAQTQVVKGKILDAQAGYSLPGATILLLGSDPAKGAVADGEGNFRLEDVPVGRQDFAIYYIGYRSTTIPNILVTAGKEVILTIKLEESVDKLEEVVVTADAQKDLPLNDFAKVSARTFCLEEVTRYSGGRNDVARLATNFAGVSTANDSRNDIIVRGNSPIGMLWRIEGIPIANTNHFATFGTSGGPVNALNTNLLRTSDFLTGAFPAEYGNATSAVFDVQFRTGNTDQHEYTAQVSAFSGLELMAEGPISRERGSSYVASYRYGIASLAATGTSATPYFQDFSFKVSSGETKLGRFELFGFGGNSSIDFWGDKIDEKDLFADPNQDAFIENKIGLLGISHLGRINKTTVLKSTLGISTVQNQYKLDNLIRGEGGTTIDKYRAVVVDDAESRYSFSSQLDKKYSARFSARLGVLAEVFSLDNQFLDRDRRVNIPDADGDGVPDYFMLMRSTDRAFPLMQAYGQGEYRFTDQLNLSAGLHGQYLELTDDCVVEPRAAVSWEVLPGQKLSLAYGLHSQMVPLPVLLIKEEIAPGEYAETNSELDFIKSHHLVLGYDRKFGQDWRLKAESYYQYLYDVPVERQASSYSVINEGADYGFDARGSLVNEGTGQNYGVELTLEKFFSRGYYALLTGSTFESTYKGSDGIRHNTAYNNNWVTNALVGKEWKLNDRNALTLDTKLTTSGGRPYTPIDLEATRANAGRELKQVEKAYSERYASYFRWDVKLGYRINSAKRKLSHQFFIDFQNITNRENEFIRRYNRNQDKIDVVNQIGFFPDVLYRIQF